MFSIRYKILSVVVLLVGSAIFVHLMLAIGTFSQDKTELIYDLNRNAVTTLITELDTNLGGAVDKLRLFSMIYSHQNNQLERDSFSEILESDPLVVRIELNDGQKTIQTFEQKQLRSFYEIPKDYFTSQLAPQRPVPFEAIMRNNVAVWNATIPGGPPLIGIGAKIDGKTKVFAAIAYVKTDLFLKNIKSSKAASIFVVDNQGKILVHPYGPYMEKNINFAGVPVVGQFLKNPKMTQVSQYSYSGFDFFGACSRAGLGGIAVISQIDSSQAFSAVKKLTMRSTVVATIIFTITFIVSILFSRSLTNPIYQLMKAMRRVAQGRMDVEFQTSTRDEIAVLGGAFNLMTRDLAASRQELVNINATLEKKVQERTAQLEEMAIKDALTGLYNRRHFNSRLAEEFQKAKRHKYNISLIYFDIDHFKKYNDNNGHPEGDALLVGFAKILQANVRTSDVLARLGGEEFCVILPVTPGEGALALAEKLRKAIESTDFPHGEKQPMKRVTCSLGVSEFPTHASNPEDLVKAADLALYHAKEGGRNRTGVATPMPHAEYKSTG